MQLLVEGESHPGLMSGHYLPPLRDWEVEIARLVMATATEDVISLRARPSERGIAYSLVDEYQDCGSRFEFEPEQSAAPLLLGQVILVFANATNTWFGDDCSTVFSLRIEDGFFSFDSEFYPELKHFFEAEDERFANRGAV